MALLLGVRHWEHVVPLALGDVPAPVEMVRLDATPNLWGEAELDAGETSFSRYVRARARGDDRVVALPLFLMRGFRQRCIIVRKDSGFTAAEQLKAGRVGLTGWPDSGNTWTRAVLREAGVGVEDVAWQVGPLTSAHPVTDRIGDATVGDNVRHTASGATLVDLLAAGDIDAVMTPFMPPGFFEPGSPFRPLFPDVRAAEADYFRRHGFIPGMHVLAVRAEHLSAQPSLAGDLMDAFEAAKWLSRARRDKLMDVTPWHNEEIATANRIIGPDWMPYGLSADRHMVAAFQAELVAQHLLRQEVPEEDLFPWPVEPSSVEERSA